MAVPRNKKFLGLREDILSCNFMSFGREEEQWIKIYFEGIDEANFLNKVYGRIKHANTEFSMPIIMDRALDLCDHLKGNFACIQHPFKMLSLLSFPF